MPELLTGKRIVVTGAARGIGLAVAKAVRAEGGSIALADIDEDLCHDAASSIVEDGGKAVAVEMDVADSASIASALEQAAAFLGGIDGLVNNAAMLDESHSATITLERFSRVMDVNSTSILRLVQASLPWLERSRGAAVVNTLSTQAFFGQPNSVAYGAAKGAALNLTRCLAVDLAPKGIRVNGVAPGFIDTRMAVTAAGEHEHQTDWFTKHYIGARKIPLGRGGSPEDCAGAFVFLLSDQSAYITGHVIVVDGGMSATY
jgi:3-oxoacyl-[acyl-carrier protein] reductase